MRKPSSILVGGQRFDVLPPRKSAKKARAPMSRDRGGEVRLGPTAQRQLEGLARLEGCTLNVAATRAIAGMYEVMLRNAKDALHSPYEPDRRAGKEDIAVLKGGKTNTARNLRDR